MSDPLKEEIKKADKVNGTLPADRLKSIIERIERLEDEKDALASDIRDVYAESKSAGFDNKTLRKIFRLRKMEPADRDEADHLLDTYRNALGL